MRKLLLSWANKVRSCPQISTLFAAVILSFVWTLAWLVVLSLVAFSTKSGTNFLVFICSLWASVSAEGLVRWVENSSFANFFSRPHNKKVDGDNSDYTSTKGFLLFLVGPLLIFSLIGIVNITDISVEELGQFAGYNSADGIEVLFKNWGNFITSVPVLLGISVGFFLRIIIYKRSSIKVLST